MKAFIKQFLLLPALLCGIFLLLSSTPDTDKSRKVTKWLTDKNGARIRVEEYKEFNSQGDLVKWMQYFDEGEICELFDIRYQGDNRQKEIRKYCNGSGSTYKLFKYDPESRLASEEWYNEKQKLTNTRVFKYRNTTRQPYAYDDIDPKDQHPNFTVTVEYYPNNLLKKETCFADEDWYSTKTYAYDKEKQLIFKAEEVDGGVGLVKTYYIYKDGQLYQDSVVIPGEETEYHLYVIEN